MTVEIPGYRILSTLGKGGMATVYLAEHEIFRRKVALKVMAPALAEDPSFGKRFMREARIVSQLVHPNIVTVYDVGVHEGSYYLSMEYIEGEDLKQARKTLELQRKVQVILDIAKALAYAGNKGYVHRDIKPENIMIYAEDCRAVLTDFGIARAAELDACVTQTGTAIGTPHYMSPEQAKGQPVDIRSDIYGLGVVFYLLLVGCVPYDAETAVAIGIKHITDPIPELPKGLEALQPIIDKMMAKLPEDRYQTPAHLVWDLQNLDLPALLEAAEAAYHEAEESLHSDADAPTLISRSSARGVSGGVGGGVGGSGGEGANGAGQPGTSADPTLLQEPTPLIVEEPFELEPESSSIWPWIAGILVLIAVVGGVYYSQNQTNMGQQEVTETTVDGEERAAPTPSNVDPSQPTLEEEAAAAPESTGESADAVEQERITQLRERIEALTVQVEEDPAQLERLLDARRELAQMLPEGITAEAAAEAVVRNEVARIRQLARAANISAARQRFEQLQSLSQSREFVDYAELEAFLAQQEQVAQWLQEGQSLLEEGHLINPEEDNARARFEQVLAVEPGNARALDGLNLIADRLVQRAGDALDNDRRMEAAQLLDTALALQPGNQQATDLQLAVEDSAGGRDEAESESVPAAEATTPEDPTGPGQNAVAGDENDDPTSSPAEQVDQLLHQARRQMEEANYFQPPGRSAYDFIQQALELRPEYTETEQLLERMLNDFEARMFNLLAVGHVDVVRGLVENAREQAPHDPELAALEVRVKDAVAERLLQTEPRILDIAISGVALSGAEASEPARVQTDRSLTVNFRYQNFGDETTVIHATLMDGSRTTQIAQVPVVLTEDEGIKAFRIDRPVDGYPSGRYFIELHSGNTTFAGGIFQVQ